MYPRLASISLHIAEDDLDFLLLPIPPKHCDHRFMPTSPDTMDNDNLTEK